LLWFAIIELCLEQDCLLIINTNLDFKEILFNVVIIKYKILESKALNQTN